MQTVDEAHEVAKQFVARTCLGFVMGDGSFVSVDFEPQRPRLALLGNRNLTPEQRAFQAEYRIFVQCAWRLDSPNSVVCGGWDDDNPEGPKERGFQRIVGQRVETIYLSEPGLDLDLKFENGLVLRIFCDQVNETDENNNYSLFTPLGTLTVGTKSRIRWEKR